MLEEFMKRFAGNSVVVTGAAKVIGKANVKLFASEGT